MLIIRNIEKEKTISYGKIKIVYKEHKVDTYQPNLVQHLCWGDAECKLSSLFSWKSNRIKTFLF